MRHNGINLTMSLKFPVALHRGQDMSTVV